MCIIFYPKSERFNFVFDAYIILGTSKILHPTMTPTKCSVVVFFSETRMNDTHANYVDVCKFANISGVPEKGQFKKYV